MWEAKTLGAGGFIYLQTPERHTITASDDYIARYGIGKTISTNNQIHLWLQQISSAPGQQCLAESCAQSGQADGWALRSREAPGSKLRSFQDR